jgi:ABC-type Fe3+/spermidine/putrescine transport system ATPase subunit
MEGNQAVASTAVESGHTARASTSAYLRLEQVVKRFGATAAVDQVSLGIPRGAFATLLGPSGCGKTTLLRLIAGFHDPDGGAIYLDEQRIDHLPAHKRGAAMVFQDYALFPHLRVYDNVAYGLRLAGMRKLDIEQRVQETLQFVDLSGLVDRWPSQLSGGQQQRVALARAFAVHPKVLLLDEPLSNLDASLRERMRWDLRALQQRLHITFVYVTHDQGEALAMSDWIAVMNRGRVEQWGTPREIYFHPRTPFLAEFVGAANLQPVAILGCTEQGLVIALGQHRLTLPAPAGCTLTTGDAVQLCIRPETLIITSRGMPVASGVNSRGMHSIGLDGCITRSAFLGHVMRYWLCIDNQEWIVDQASLDGTAEPLHGAVTMWLNPERMHVILAA